MNKHPGKQYPHAAQGPAPPLPPGQPPAQQQHQNPYGQTPEQAAAHAAAWAAYYQSQGITQQAYSAPATPAQPPAAGTPTVSNPYANYGYGAGAQHNKPQPVAGPSQPYRPPPNTQAYATAATQPSLGYGQQQYQAYPARPQSGARPPHQAAPVAGAPPAAAAAPAGQQAYAWGQAQPQVPMQQQQQQQQQQPGFRPQPVAQQPYPAYQQQYYSPAAQQPYTPPPQQSPYRPNINANPSPSPMQPPAPTPFRPPAQQNRPPRPPMSNPQAGGPPSGPGGGFPPAKRPRFDAPPGPAGNRMNNRPPISNNNNMNAANPMQAGGPKQGTGPSQGQPFGNRNVSGRGPHNQFHGHGQNAAAAAAAAAAASVRPPIHLGNGGPPPVAFNAGPSGPAAMGLGPGAGAGVGAGMVRPALPAGGMAAPMRGHPARGRGAPNAPRGPANMRRNANANAANGNDVSSTFSASSSAGNLPGFNQGGGGGGGGGGFKGNKGFEKAQAKKRNQGGKEKDNKEVKPTMTDFRIVGVKFGSGQDVWEWGIVDGKVPDVVGAGIAEGENENQLQAQAQAQAQTETHDGLVKVEEEETEPASVSASASMPASQANQSPEEKVAIKQEPESLDPSPAVEGEGEGVTARSVTGTEAEEVEEKDKVKDEEKEGKDEKEQEKEKEKRGEKRKAKSPDAEDEHSAKRTAAYLLAHKKSNLASNPPSLTNQVPTPGSGPGSGGNTTSTSAFGPGATGAATATTTTTAGTNAAGSNALSKFESNSNRFRIYFNSPPELDRTPKVRGNAGNKRWRRDSSVATSVMAGGVGGGEKVVEGEGKEQGQGQGQKVEPRTEQQGQEQSERTQGEPVEGEAASSTKPNAETETETQQDVAVSGPIFDASVSAATRVPVEGEAETNEQDQDQVEQAIEGQLSFAGEGEGEAEGEGEELLGYHQPEQVQESGAQETVEAEIEQGDVSMRTDPGGLDAFLQDPLDDQVPADGEAETLVENDAAADDNMVPEEGEGNVVEQQNGQEDEAASVAADKVQSTDAPTTGEEQPSAAVITTPDIPNPAEPNIASEGASATPASTKEKKVADDSAEAIAAALAASASNTASAYKTRARRHSSVSTTSEHPRAHGSTTTTTTTNINTNYKGGAPQSKEGQPSWNRLSILWEDSRRRMCFDVDVVDKVRIWRKEGKIEVELKMPETSEQEEGTEARLPKGVLMELWNKNEDRFVPYSIPDASSLNSPTESDPTVPPFHLLSPNLSLDKKPLTVTVYLNQKNPLSEPKWLRTNTADAWLFESFESRKGVDAGWRGKLEVVDPDPAPTLQSILDNWASNSSLGTPSSRRAFIADLSSSPNDLLEILLRLARGERNPTLGTSTVPSFGPLATLIRPDSPFASHQTHVSLAILAMYRLTTDYAAKAGESLEVVEEKVGDIIRTLPTVLVGKSLDGLFKEWQGGDGR
ncbi:hypothetical protein AYX15_04748 [Cryptococcus neoformans]|nr:hypothetical protein AYX15_04748 [Cryptococcus neoformans var. grubii]